MLDPVIPVLRMYSKIRSQQKDLYTMCGDCRGSLGRPSEKGCYAIMSKISEDKYCICSAFLLLPLGLEWLFFF